MSARRAASATRSRASASPACVLALLGLVLLAPLLCAVVDASTGGAAGLGGPGVDEASALHGPQRCTPGESGSSIDPLPTMAALASDACVVVLPSRVRRDARSRCEPLAPRTTEVARL